jgi:hypothetical protein
MPEPNVEIREKKIWVNGTPISLLGGEVHYWRLAPESWRDVLARVQEMGLHVVATYICWEFHELGRGKFDFHGQTDPRRNLVGFLNLLTEMDFWIIIRPGPYIYAEWVNAGVPETAAQYHRLDPNYLNLAREYLQAVVPVIQPYFATRGGRIILCQAENELDCWPHMYTQALGLGKQAGLFQSFLAERYKATANLNRAWGTHYEGFEQARAVLTCPPDRVDLFPRYLDFYRFKHWYVLQASKWVVNTNWELGVDIPLLMNTIPVHANEPWAEMEKVADLVGTDLYPSNTFQRIPDEHQKYLEAVRYLRTYSCLPYICEFEAGIWHGGHLEREMGALEAKHYRMSAVSALLAGAAGWNWYMLANRDNWYMSPINEWGRMRVDLFQVFAKMVEVYQAIDPTTLIKLTDVAVTIDPLQQAAAHSEADLLKALYQADIDYEFFDVHEGQIEKPYLFYGGGTWLDEEAQERLVDYICNGGHLICLGARPIFDERLQALNRLGIPEPAGRIGDMGEIDLIFWAGKEEVKLKSRWLEYFEAVPGDPVVVERGSVDEMAVEEMQFLCNLPRGERYTIGFTQTIGKGKLTYLGLQPTRQLIRAVFTLLGMTYPSQTDCADVSTGLFQRGDHFYLCVVNCGNEEKSITIHLYARLFGHASLQVDDLIGGSSQDLSISHPARLVLSLPGKDATIVKISRQ